MSIGDKVTITIDGRTCEGVIVNDNTIQLQPRPCVVIIDSVPSKAYDAIHAAFMAADITVVDHDQTLDMVLRPSFDMPEPLEYLIDPNEPPTDGAKAVQHLRSRKRLRW